MLTCVLQGNNVMDNGLSWALDIIIVLIILAVIFANSKKGVAKVLIIAIGYISATVLASVLSSVAAPPLYESIARQTNLIAMEAVVKNVNIIDAVKEIIDEQQYGFQIDRDFVKKTLKTKEPEVFEETLYEHVIKRIGNEEIDKTEFNTLLRKGFVAKYGKELNDRMPKYVLRNFEKEVLTKGSVLRELAVSLAQNSDTYNEGAEILEDTFSRKPSTQVLQIFLYLIFFSIMMTMAGFISSVMQNKMFFNLRNSTDHLIGGILGILEAGATMVLLTFIAYLVVMLTGNELNFFNEEIIQKTKVFSLFYNQISLLL